MNANYLTLPLVNIKKPNVLKHTYIHTQSLGNRLYNLLSLLANKTILPYH